MRLGRLWPLSALVFDIGCGSRSSLDLPLELEPAGGQPATSGGVATSGGSATTGGRGGSGGMVANSGGRIASGGSATSGGFVSSGGRTPGGGRTAAGGTAGFGGRTRGSGGAPNATGGSAGTGGTAAGCPSLGDKADWIDDLNDNNAFIHSINGRSGAWRTAHDPTPGAMMFPSPLDFFATDSGDRCRRFAAYVSGGRFALWGASFGFGLGAPYDAGQYTGIRFWAKADPTSTRLLRVGFADQFSHPQGGICVPNATTGTGCYDHWGYRITLPPVWTQITVPFSSLSQDGWGLQAPFDPSTLFEITFQIPANATFGIWIDDLAFVR